MEQFSEKLMQFFSDFGKGRKMVLSTSENNRVSSRMISVVQINGEFYFQTDKELRKHHQLSVNRYAALCIDNIQIEGICVETGHPLDNAEFCALFRECFRGSFDAYTALKNERLFIFRRILSVCGAGRRFERMQCRRRQARHCCMRASFQAQ